MDKYWLLPRERTCGISELPLESQKIDMLRSVDALRLCAWYSLRANRLQSDVCSTLFQTFKEIIASANHSHERRTSICLHYAPVLPASRTSRLRACEEIMQVSLTGSDEMDTVCTLPYFPPVIGRRNAAVLAAPDYTGRRAKQQHPHALDIPGVVSGAILLTGSPG